MDKLTSATPTTTPATLDLGILKGNPTTAQRNGRACVQCNSSDYPLKSAGTLPDIIRLTDDQLDGIACIRCARTDAPMVVAGSGEHGQLFECADSTAQDDPAPRAENETIERSTKTRAYWQTTPCPPWCGGTHRDMDHPTERVHQGLYFSTPLTETEPEQYGPNIAGETLAYQPPPLMACLIQHVRYAVPDIEMCVGDGETGATLTLDEAEQIAGNLTELIAQGRGAPPVQTPAEGCVPWCVNHTNESVCWSKSIVTTGGDVDLSYMEGNGAEVHLAADVSVLTVEQAEQLAHAILKQTAIARGITPSSS